MKRLLTAALLACTCMSGVAEAHFIDGYAALCSAVGTGTCTEITATGYARQPAFFTAPVNGVSPLGNPITFGLSASIAGRAIFDAPTGGNLLMVLPVTTTVSANGITNDVGTIKLTMTALVPYLNGETYVGKVAATTAFGTTSDGGALSSGVALDIFRGTVVPQGFTW